MLVDLLQALLERYDFRTVPNINETDISKGISFKNGAIVINETRFSIDQFSIYNDGLLVEASTTDIAEQFLEDFIKWGNEKLQLREFIRPPKKSYFSTVVVEFECSIDYLIKDFEDITSLMIDSFSSVYGEIVTLGLQLAFGQDAAALPTSAVYPDFNIERRVGMPTDYNRFFSGAPLTTKAHIELLQAIEAKNWDTSLNYSPERRSIAAVSPADLETSGLGRRAAPRLRSGRACRRPR